jgi:hypothetical protein
MWIQLPAVSMMLASSVTAQPIADPAAPTAATDVMRAPDHDAQVELADVLGDADAIEAVLGHGDQVAFEIVHNGEQLEVMATTHHSELVAIAIRDRGPTLGWTGTDEGIDDNVDARGLSWLSDVMRETTAVTRLEVDRDGAVTLSTTDGQRYMVIPGRGSGGNAAVEARWAAEWDRD